MVSLIFTVYRRRRQKEDSKRFFAENPGYKWARKMVEELVSGLEEETYDVDDVMFLISDKVPEVENKLRSNLSEEGIEKKKIFFNYSICFQIFCLKPRLNLWMVKKLLSGSIIPAVMGVDRTDL